MIKILLFTLKTYSNFLGVCHMYLKELEPAKEELVRALNYHKKDQSFLTLGKILLMQGDINGAIDVYRQGVQ
jgi:hypothetical protein